MRETSCDCHPRTCSQEPSKQPVASRATSIPSPLLRDPTAYSCPARTRPAWRRCRWSSRTDRTRWWVWFDAHADLNTPHTSPTGYLGGLAFSEPMGWLDSGLGDGLQAHNCVLVGVREIDPDEQQLINDSEVELVKVSPALPDELRLAVARGRSTCTSTVKCLSWAPC